jgi:mono/diheme cytochrome c family protein
MKQFSAAIISAALAACASPPALSSGSSQQARGLALAEANCSGCHSVGAAGESPASEAPPFRHLSQNYPVETLAEALAEGISVGHPAMPEFQFEPDDVDALIAYLQSIQDGASPQGPLTADGRDIAMSECSSCHAVLETGASPNPDAPPFRTVLSRYNADVLEEELIAGVQVAHEMPDFHFNPQAADALIAYLRTIQSDQSELQLQ